MRLNSSGNFSIGNTNDSYIFDVTGTGRFYNTHTTNSIDSVILHRNIGAGSGNQGPVLLFQTTNSSPSTWANARIRAVTSQVVAGGWGGDLYFETTPTGSAVTTSTCKMTITADGKVGIGITNPGFALDVVGAVAGQSSGNIANLVGINTNGSYTNAVSYMQAATSNTSGYLYYGVGNGFNTFRVTTNGDVQNTNNSYAGISDEKLKNNIKPVTRNYTEDFKKIQFKSTC